MGAGHQAFPLKKGWRRACEGRAGLGSMREREFMRRILSIAEVHKDLSSNPHSSTFYLSVHRQNVFTSLSVSPCENKIPMSPHPNRGPVKKLRCATSRVPLVLFSPFSRLSVCRCQEFCFQEQRISQRLWNPMCAGHCHTVTSTGHEREVASPPNPCGHG